MIRFRYEPDTYDLYDDESGKHVGEIPYGESFNAPFLALILAAPALVTALQEACHVLKTVYDYEPMDRWLAAIAKATGETP